MTQKASPLYTENDMDAPTIAGNAFNTWLWKILLHFLSLYCPYGSRTPPLPPHANLYIYVTSGIRFEEHARDVGE